MTENVRECPRMSDISQSVKQLFDMMRPAAPQSAPFLQMFTHFHVTFPLRVIAACGFAASLRTRLGSFKRRLREQRGETASGRHDAQRNSDESFRCFSSAQCWD